MEIQTYIKAETNVLLIPSSIIGDPLCQHLPVTDFTNKANATAFPKSCCSINPEQK